VTEAERDRFDALVEDAIAALPPQMRAMLDEVPVVVLDEPELGMLRDLGVNPAREPGALDEICGLHTGTMLTERGVEHADLPTVIHLFRRGIVSLAGGWDQPDAEDEVYEEVRITLLHEIGHHFGLEEGDLEDLGYE
jgi:predicted Zn-dependent protease with MMP-like domain